MLYTFKPARRLAQAHVLAAGVFILACNDSSAPSAEHAANPPAQESIPLGVGAGSATYPNEPAGFTIITDRPFDKKVELGWRDRGDNEFSIIQDGLAPKSPNQVGKAQYHLGDKGGTGPIYTWYVLPKPVANLYLSCWVRFSKNFYGHPTGMNKVLHFWIAGSNRVILKGRGAGMATLRANIKLTGVNHSPSSYDINGNLGAADKMTRGTWHRVEIVLRVNTGSNKNGTVTWWVDGQMVGNYTNMGFVTASESHLWSEIAWNPTWGGVGWVLDRDQDMQIDHVYLSGI